MPDSRLQPTPWLLELARPKPAVWQWNRAIRGALCVGLPLGIGLLSGYLAIGVWMGIASLTLLCGEGSGSYHSRFKIIAISASIGSLGCLVGYIGVLPWAWIVLIMAALAFICGVISSYGAPASNGALQFLILAAVAIGRPQIAPFWEPTLYYLLGAGFYALVMGIEAMLLRSQPRRKLTADLVSALGQLAQSRADALASAPQNSTGEEAPQPQAVEEKRQAVTALQTSLYADILDRSNRRNGRTSEIDAIWAILQYCDTAFAQILSSNSRDSLLRAAKHLALIASAIAAGKKTAAQVRPDPADGADPLQRCVSAMASAGLWSHSPFSPIVMRAVGKETTVRQPHLSILRDRLLPGKETLLSSLALAICLGIAYATHWLDHDTRWYWVPLTVAIVMKPDYGSLFARSLLRSIGTLIGAIVGSVILILFPKGPLLVLAIAALAACIPWAGQRSYAILGIAVTPLVLVLIDLTVPGTINVNYGLQRIVGTLIGAGIVLIFGYFLWPRTHFKEIANVFARANDAISAYLLCVLSESRATGNILASAVVCKRRRLAYAKLTDLRTYLRKAMADPPPTGSEATAWLPIVASAERICDQITAYGVKIDGKPDAAEPEQIEQLAKAISSIATQPSGDTPKPAAAPTTVIAAATAADTELLNGVMGELHFISRSTHTAATL